GGQPLGVLPGEAGQPVLDQVAADDAVADAPGEGLVDERPRAAVGGEGRLAAGHQLREGNVLEGLVPDPGVLDPDHGSGPGGRVPALAAPESPLPNPGAAVAPAGLEPPNAVGRQPGRELPADLTDGRVQVGVGAPAELPGGVQHLLGPHPGDDVRMRADPDPR